MKPSEAAEILKGVEQFEGNLPEDGLIVEEAWQMAISALKKQEQDNNKSCDTCKHKNLRVSEFPCDECYFASYLEDHYEPYTEEET